MTKQEILQTVVNVHNTMVQIQVSGDSAISMGGALIEMRELAQKLQKDIKEEAAAKNSAENDDGKSNG